MMTRDASSGTSHGRIAIVVRSTESFAKKVEGTLPTEVRDAWLPLVRLVEALSNGIKGYDERIEKLATEKYTHTKLLRQVKGVGPLTSLAYVLTLQDPQRLVKSRGLVPNFETNS